MSNAQPATIDTNLYMEFTLLSFTRMQQQIAMECRFYLVYHTQLTAEEIASIIILIQDLTHGSNFRGSLGSSLPQLNPLFEDMLPTYCKVAILFVGVGGSANMTKIPWQMKKSMLLPMTVHQGILPEQQKCIIQSHNI